MFHLRSIIRPISHTYFVIEQTDDGCRVRTTDGVAQNTCQLLVVLGMLCVFNGCPQDAECDL